MTLRLGVTYLPVARQPEGCVDKQLLLQSMAADSPDAQIPVAGGRRTPEAMPLPLARRGETGGRGDQEGRGCRYAQEPGQPVPKERHPDVGAGDGGSGGNGRTYNEDGGRPVLERQRETVGRRSLSWSMAKPMGLLCPTIPLSLLSMSASLAAAAASAASLISPTWA